MTRLAALALAVAITACAESSATVEKPDPWDTRTADPAFVRRAEATLADAEPPSDGWHVGVILAEHDEHWDWEASVLTDEGPVFLQACATHNDGLGLITDPGDLINWSPAGDDHRVCTDELVIVKKAAA